MRTEEFNHIILPMRSNLKAYALRLTESDDNAEDLVQEVMLRLWDMRLNIKAEDNLIKQIVAQLPPLQQQIFRMKEIEGYTADEIMQITGCTADNLRKNLSRARLKIRETYMNIVKQNKIKKEEKS